MKLFVDDLRVPPDNSWTVARSSEDAIALLQRNKITEVSLDHDLGIVNDFFDDGYKVVVWLEERNIWPVNGIRCHSANPVGVQRINAAIAAIKRRNGV